MKTTLTLLTACLLLPAVTIPGAGADALSDDDCILPAVTPAPASSAEATPADATGQAIRTALCALMATATACAETIQSSTYVFGGMLSWRLVVVGTIFIFDPPVGPGYPFITTRVPVVDAACNPIGHVCYTMVGDGSTIVTNTMGLPAVAAYKGAAAFAGVGQCAAGAIAFHGCTGTQTSQLACLHTQ